MSFIEILEEDETFEWSPEGSASVFVLRRIPLSQRNAIYRKHTKKRRGVEERDADAIAREFLDLSIVDWREVYVKKNGVRSELECSPKYRMLLSEQIKTDVINMCVNGESPEGAQDPFEPATSSESTSDGSPMKAIK